MILLDTNVLSALMQPQPPAAVVGWVRRTTGETIVTTAVSVAEIRYGIARLPTGRRRSSIAEVVDRVLGSFRDAVLPFDADAAAQYADIVAKREAAGRPISVFDAQIAAIARVAGAVVASRNVRDFEGVGVDVTDPYRD